MKIIAKLILLPFLGLLFLQSSIVNAAPMFARQYGFSCVTCHSAFPKLNNFGHQFADDNYRISNWKETTLKTGDPELALPASIPMAIRAQGFVQARDAETIDVTTGERTEVDNDIQAPYLIKLLSSAPLSDHITFYFYGIFAEKGGNGETIIEDAWFSHDDVFGTGVGMMLGQFQVSDLMFPRETRLTFQDYMAYRMAGITYDRGFILSHGFGNIDLDIGFVNGNGIEENFTINSPGYRRSDHLFDNDNNKAIFARVGTNIGPVATGLFAFSGEQKNSTGAAGTVSGNRDTDKNIIGLDVNGQVGSKVHWFGQALWNEWDGFINQNTNYKWFGMFIGVDYINNSKWTYSLLYNYANADDFDNSDTVYEGIDIHSLTVNTSYFFMRNVKGIIELNYDFLDEETQSGTYYTGHLTQENYFLLGFDAAF